MLSSETFYILFFQFPFRKNPASSARFFNFTTNFGGYNSFILNDLEIVHNLSGQHNALFRIWLTWWCWRMHLALCSISQQIQPGDTDASSTHFSTFIEKEFPSKITIKHCQEHAKATGDMTITASHDGLSGSLIISLIMALHAKSFPCLHNNLRFWRYSLCQIV